MGLEKKRRGYLKSLQEHLPHWPLGVGRMSADVQIFTDNRKSIFFVRLYCFAFFTAYGKSKVYGYYYSLCKT